MRKSLHLLALIALAASLFLASQAFAQEGPRVRAAMGDASKHTDSGLILVYGTSRNPGTQQLMSFLAAHQKNLRAAGAEITVCLTDLQPGDAAFNAQARAKGWDKLDLQAGDDGSLQRNLSAVGHAGPGGSAIFVIDDQGYIGYYDLGRLSAKQQDLLIKAALRVSKNLDIRLSPSVKKLDKGKTFSLKPSISPKMNGKYIQYKSSDPSVVSVSQAGKVKALNYGNATVTAVYGGVEASCEVTVTGPLKKITLNEKSLAIAQGDAYKLELASIEPFNAEVNYDNATWTSSNPRVASVDNDGNIAALSGGAAKISYKLGGKTATCTVKVAADLSSAPLVEQVLEFVNQERDRTGAVRLKNYAPLERAANIRAVEISKSFAHTRPNGASCFTVLPYAVSYGGENIARGFRDPEALVDAWMGSPSHKKNILNRNYRESGIGLYELDGKLHWVQLFTKKK